MSGGRRLFNHGRILLGDLIHLVDGRIDLAESSRLLLRTGSDLDDDLVDIVDLLKNSAERFTRFCDQFNALSDLSR